MALPLTLAALLTASAATVTIPPELYAASALSKVLAVANSTSAPTTWPEYTADGGDGWELEPLTDWTSSFFPLSLYTLAARDQLCPSTADGTDWLSLARTWSAPLYNPSSATLTSWLHDVGFNTFPMLEELKLNRDNETAKATVLSNAAYLATRYSSVVGCTKSWDRGDDDFEVIIDNMMNLQLLTAASTLSSNSTLLEMAISHANKTLANHVRADGSSFHVVDYSPTTGDAQWSGTAQGLSNSSTWSRGQAWGTLGFALMANFTGDVDYLETSRRMATFFLDGLPARGVSLWDFNATTAPTTLDTSASSILASALLVLSSFESSLGNVTAASHWSDSAVTLLGNVVEQGVTDWTGASIVGNGTVNNRADPPNNNTGIIYGDWGFLLAGNHLLQLGLANCTDGTPAVGASSTALSSSLFTTSVSMSSGDSTTTTSAGSSSGSGGSTSAGGQSAGSPIRAFKLMSGVGRWIDRW